MASTFQKRQKEIKRQEKQRMKEERRAQKKLDKRSGKEDSSEELTVLTEPQPLPEFEPQN